MLKMKFWPLLVPILGSLFISIVIGFFWSLIYGRFFDVLVLGPLIGLAFGLGIDILYVLNYMLRKKKT